MVAGLPSRKGVQQWGWSCAGCVWGGRERDEPRGLAQSSSQPHLENVALSPCPHTGQLLTSQQMASEHLSHLQGSRDP